MDLFQQATGLGGTPLAKKEDKAFMGSMTIKGVPVVTRSALNNLYRDLLGALPQAVASRLFGATVNPQEVFATSTTERLLKDRVRSRISTLYLSDSNIQSLLGDGLEFLPDPDGFAFLDGNPTRYRIAYSGVSEFGATGFYRARSYTFSFQDIAYDQNGITVSPGTAYWGFLESEIQFGRFFQGSIGYPTRLKLAGCSWRRWDVSFPFGVIGERADVAPSDPIDALWPGFNYTNWANMAPDGTFRGTPTTPPTASSAAGIGDTSGVVWPKWLTAYFLAIQ